ncbi:MAG: phospholipid carrier-dependent glycosyltransferase [Planctomycetota bacterium]|nr:phospholipid carrier-dependent glycosyltransferase [Planctomycetota bacterium]
MTWTRAALIVIAVWIVADVLTLGVRPLIAPDETRYALIGWEMISSGDWFSLRMDGFRYYEKPPMGYWLTAASFNTFGVNAFALRLPMSLSALGTAALTALLVYRWKRNITLACIGALVSLTMLLPIILAGTAVLDGPFSFFLTGCLVCYLAGMQSTTRSRIGWMLACGVFAGLAFLTKGFLAFAVPALAVIPWLVWTKRWRALFSSPWIPLVAVAITAAPAAWILHQHEPRFWHEFFWTEHVRRFLQPDENQHAKPWWLYFAMLPLAIIPWTLNIPFALRGLSRTALSDDTVRFLLSWIVAPLLFFSAASGKLPTYILPLFPPIAALLAVGLFDYFASPAGKITLARKNKTGFFALVAIASIIGAALATGVGGFGASTLWSDGPFVRTLLFVTMLVAWGLADLAAQYSHERGRRLLLMGCVPALLALSIPILFPTGRLLPYKAPEPFLNQAKTQLRSASAVFSDVSFANAAAFVGRRADVVIVGPPSEFDNELNDPHEATRRISWNDLPTRISEARTHGDVILVAGHDTLPASLPAGATMLVSLNGCQIALWSATAP